ncbi:unnamed protein product [Nesidiocoris tenuis]|uniref:Uncharacterized protein n=1 Tax=Nesidiocoris tenuis TaxID=355587 RepID=A0A6H5GXL6_9HEMI|nr:unnamed protein product [Nesidiocoris tenuis]
MEVLCVIYGPFSKYLNNVHLWESMEEKQSGKNSSFFVVQLESSRVDVTIVIVLKSTIGTELPIGSSRFNRNLNYSQADRSICGGSNESKTNFSYSSFLIHQVLRTFLKTQKCLAKTAVNPKRWQLSLWRDLIRFGVNDHNVERSRELINQHQPNKQRTLKRIVDGNASKWMTTLSLGSDGHDLSPNQFRDALASRYGHTLNCKKVWLVNKVMTM